MEIVETIKSFSDSQIVESCDLKEHQMEINETSKIMSNDKNMEIIDDLNILEDEDMSNTKDDIQHNPHENEEINEKPQNDQQKVYEDDKQSYNISDKIVKESNNRTNVERKGKMHEGNTGINEQNKNELDIVNADNSVSELCSLQEMDEQLIEIDTNNKNMLDTASPENIENLCGAHLKLHNKDIDPENTELNLQRNAYQDKTEINKQNKYMAYTLTTENIKKPCDLQRKLHKNEEKEFENKTDEACHLHNNLQEHETELNHQSENIADKKNTVAKGTDKSSDDVQLNSLHEDLISENIAISELTNQMTNGSMTVSADNFEKYVQQKSHEYKHMEIDLSEGEAELNEQSKYIQNSKNESRNSNDSQCRLNLQKSENKKITNNSGTEHHKEIRETEINHQNKKMLDKENTGRTNDLLLHKDKDMENIFKDEAQIKKQNNVDVLQKMHNKDKHENGVQSSSNIDNKLHEEENADIIDKSSDEVQQKLHEELNSENIAIAEVTKQSKNESLTVSAENFEKYVQQNSHEYEKMEIDLSKDETVLNEQSKNIENSKKNIIISDDSQHRINYQSKNVSDLQNFENEKVRSNLETVYEKEIRFDGNENFIPRSTKNLTVSLKRLNLKEAFKKLPKCVISLKSMKLEKRQVCNICNFKFRHRSNLRRHIKTIHLKEPFKCEFCSYECQKQTAMTYHRQIVHLSSKKSITYKCDICEFETTCKDSLKRHKYKKHQNKVFKCEYCSFEGKSQTVLGEHLQYHNEYNPKMFKCEYCEFQTVHKSSKENHEKIVHQKENIVSFKCIFCDHKFTTHPHLKRHLLTHEKNPKMYKCPHCEYETRNWETHNKHIKRMHPTDEESRKNYKCAHCSYKSREKYYLKQHLELMHTDRLQLLKFNCSFCSYQTINKGRLKNHLLVHEEFNAKTFKCKLCPFETRHESSLKNHRNNIHSENPVMLKCSKCDWQTKHKESLKNHIIMLHDKDKYDLPVFKCDQCPFETKVQVSIKQHLMRHKPYDEQDKFDCRRCGISYTSKSHLNRHNQFVHSENLKIFSCDKCIFETPHKNSYDYHMSFVHGKQKNFKCHLCPHASSCQSSLNKHLKALHSIDNSNKNSVNKEMFKCKKCSFKTNKKNYLLRHVCKKYKKTPLFECHDCAFSTKHKFSIQNHILSHKLPVKIHKCEQCEYETSSKTDLSRHLRKHINRADLPKFQCDSCLYETPDQKYLKKHIRRRHETAPKVARCHLCNYQTFVQTYLKKHIIWGHKKKYTMYNCQLCTFETRDESGVASHHAKIHISHETGRFKCNKCEYQTEVVRYFTKHCYTHFDMPNRTYKVSSPSPIIYRRSDLEIAINKSGQSSKIKDMSQNNCEKKSPGTRENVFYPVPTFDFAAVAFGGFDSSNT